MGLKNNLGPHVLPTLCLALSSAQPSGAAWLAGSLRLVAVVPSACHVLLGTGASPPASAGRSPTLTSVPGLQALTSGLTLSRSRSQTHYMGTKKYPENLHLQASLGLIKCTSSYPWYGCTQVGKRQPERPSIAKRLNGALWWPGRMGWEWGVVGGREVQEGGDIYIYIDIERYIYLIHFQQKLIQYCKAIIHSYMHTYIKLKDWMEMERDHFCLWVPQIKGLHPGHAFGTNSLLPHSHFPLPCMIPLTFYFWLPLCQVFFLHRAASLQAPASGGRRKGCLFPYSGRTIGSDQLCPPFGMQNDGLCRWRH